GLDLVEMQLRVAMGEPLGLTQDDVRREGHAVEVRVYAEDPEQDFLPQAGDVRHVRWPEDARVDCGIDEDSVVTTDYDPMLAKLIAHGASRDDAFSKLDTALSETQILGPRTNIAFLREVTSHPVVREGRVTTTWMEGYLSSRPANPPQPDDVTVAVVAAAEAAWALLHPRGRQDPWGSGGSWRGLGRNVTHVVVRYSGLERAVVVAGTGPFVVDGRTVRASERPGADGPGFRIRRAHDRDNAWWECDGETVLALRSREWFGSADRGRWLVWRGTQHEIEVGPAERRADAQGAAHLEAPMPGQVIAVRVSAGDKVVRGQDLVVVEAMKMEHAVKAPADGTVKAVLCAAGDQVQRGQTLVDFEPS
ncbi:MAG TPA: biotin/lipoyl-containing protein, partial [Actinomycetota bacterium]|nr:biotin/lipoyl-containing protein [Actinomycetota bacterium]